MSSTLVAVFDSSTEAQEAARKLQAAGIDRQSIHLNGGEFESKTASAQARTTSDDEPGMISRFFSSIFGDDDAPHASNYSEAMRRGNAVLTVAVADEDRVEEISDMLDACGAVDVDERAQQWQTSGSIPGVASQPLATGRPMTANPSMTAGATDGDTFKVVEEDLKVGTRTVQKGNVRVHRRTVETPVEEQVTLHDERASIERTKVDRPATAADLQTAFTDKQIEITETTQEPVISKTARVVEEVKVGKQATDRTETVKETLRKTEVDIDNGSASGTNTGRRMYSGPERRLRSSPGYAGAERRMSA